MTETIHIRASEQGVVRVLKRVAANEAAQVRRNNAAAPHGAAANAPGNSE